VQKLAIAKNQIDFSRKVTNYNELWEKQRIRDHRLSMLG
jgi:hypothetical protein